MIRELREERGREKMALDREGHRRADVARTPLAFTGVRVGHAGVGGGAGPTPAELARSSSSSNTSSSASATATAAEARALAHCDRLLAFQTQNAQRTTVRDEAAAFETPDAGAGIWASPAERARRLKRQQAVLREMEWNARPEYERRREVVSLDFVGGKVVRRFGVAAKERERELEVREDGGEKESEKENLGGDGWHGEGDGHAQGTFSNNPLLGSGLIKPVWRGGKGKGKDDEHEREHERKKAS